MASLGYVSFFVCMLPRAINLITHREIRTYRGRRRCTMNHLQLTKIDWSGFVVSKSWPSGLVSCFTFQILPLISFCFHDFILLMTCDAPCCARRLPMYLSMYPYQIHIDFCAYIDQHFARIMYTHHLDCFAEAGRLSSRIEQIEMRTKLGTQIYN